MTYNNFMQAWYVQFSFFSTPVPAAEPSHCVRLQEYLTQMKMETLPLGEYKCLLEKLESEEAHVEETDGAGIARWDVVDEDAASSDAAIRLYKWKEVDRLVSMVTCNDGREETRLGLRGVCRQSSNKRRLAHFFNSSKIGQILIFIA